MKTSEWLALMLVWICVSVMAGIGGYFTGKKIGVEETSQAAMKTTTLLMKWVVEEHRGQVVCEQRIQDALKLRLEATENWGSCEKRLERVLTMWDRSSRLKGEDLWDTLPTEHRTAGSVGASVMGRDAVNCDEDIRQKCMESGHSVPMLQTMPRKEGKP